MHLDRIKFELVPCGWIRLGNCCNTYQYPVSRTACACEVLIPQIVLTSIYASISHTAMWVFIKSLHIIIQSFTLNIPCKFTIQ